MGLLLGPEILIGLVLVAVIARVRTQARLFGSEESAQAAALARRRSGESRYSTRDTVLILGESDTESPCRVVGVSRRTIRIHSSRAIPLDEQLQVELGDNCFVCAMRSVTARDGGYLLDLKVLSSNYHPRGPIFLLMSACSGVGQAAWRMFTDLLRQVAVKVLGAKLRRRTG